MPVYFIGQLSKGECFLKIGVSGKIERRLKQLQTGSAFRLELMGWVLSDDDYKLERSLQSRLKKYHHRGEWFRIEPSDILQFLSDAKNKGFVAKNSDAFEIIGYDRDAGPEYLGVWQWADLEFEECCPFCGCFCGMHFNEAASMYHCLNCDELTNFEGINPNFHEEGNC